MMIRADFRYLYTLSNSPAKDVLEFCWSLGLISSSYNCPKCGNPMKLSQRFESLDHYEWACRSKAKPPHSITRSIRSGSWFSRSRLPITDILLLTHYFVLDIPHNIIQQELCLSSTTVNEWRKSFRVVCFHACRCMNEPIGGNGAIVEVNVMKCDKQKSKVRKGKHKWLYGGVERYSNKCFFQIAEMDDKPTFINILNTLLLPGTTVYSNCWGSDNFLEDNEFKGVARNRSLIFKENESGTETNSIDSLWRSLKKTMPNVKANDDFELFLSEYVWRRHHSSCEDLTKEFLQEVGHMCPPHSHDVPAEVLTYDATKGEIQNTEMEVVESPTVEIIDSSATEENVILEEEIEKE